MTEDRDWQRLDKWLWCARFLRSRPDCARLVAGGLVRLNQQVTEKPHARLRPGDVLTLPLPGGVRVVRVLEMALRRGPAAEARLLYEEIAERTAAERAERATDDTATDDTATDDTATLGACAPSQSPAYPPACAPPAGNVAGGGAARKLESQR
jgi:ribosome-associated heat shock protein Hsp15